MLQKTYNGLDKLVEFTESMNQRLEVFHKYGNNGFDKKMMTFSQLMKNSPGAPTNLGGTITHCKEVYKENNDAQGNPIVDEIGCIVIKPKPRFAIKAKDDNGKKMFVNFTTHDLIDENEMSSVAS